MRKLVALALLALALGGGVAVVSVERPTSAHADCGSARLLKPLPRRPTMRKLIALALLALALAGGVAAVSTFTAKPALACDSGSCP